MKKLLLLLITLCTLLHSEAQNKPPAFRSAPKLDLPPIGKYILATQDNLALYKQNYASNNAQEHDVNSIIKDIEQYLNLMPKTRSYSDQLLSKEFNPLRHFFLTTTNKTSVAAAFLYSVNPYQFCSFNDTAAVLYLFAVKDGTTYNLDKMTEKKVIRNVLEQCLLPSLKALDEFKDNEIKYIGLSVYYGCKDTRAGAPKEPVTPYCLTMLARLDDLQQYEAGLTTLKGLLANAELYSSDGSESNELNRIRVNVD